MDNNKLQKIREVAKKVKESHQDKAIDYQQMTAPCGLPCFECYVHLANNSSELRELISEIMGIPAEIARCDGCRNQEGKCAFHEMPCRVYPCAKEKKVKHCGECPEFPCDYLHPYHDRAHLWHNTKVFNLCLINKMGLVEWAKNKAGNVLDTYSYGKWTL